MMALMSSSSSSEELLSRGVSGSLANQGGEREPPRCVPSPEEKPRLLGMAMVTATKAAFAAGERVLSRAAPAWRPKSSLLRRDAASRSTSKRRMTAVHRGSGLPSPANFPPPVRIISAPAGGSTQLSLRITSVIV